MRTLCRLIAILLPVILVAAPASTPPASAHVFLFKSVPAEGEVLPAPPQRIWAEFTSELAASGSVIALFNAAGARVDNLDTTIDPADARRLAVTLPPLPPGAYHAVWTAVDVLDGHPSEGFFDFAIGGGEAPPAASPPAAAEPQAAPEASAIPDPLPAPEPTAVVEMVPEAETVQ